jgi:hypothetical protein
MEDSTNHNENVASNFDIIHITSSNTSFKDAQIIIYNESGKIAMTTGLQAGSNRYIDVSGLPSGFYIIKDYWMTNNETSNEVFFWELDQDGNILKTYKFTDENKINLEITDIDLKGNLLGLGYEYANDRNFFVILGENSSFLSNVGNVENGWKDLLVYPNPASDEILIKSEANLTSVKIFDIFGREVFCSMNLQPYAISIDIRNLVAGSYHLLLSDGSI